MVPLLPMKTRDFFSLIPQIKEAKESGKTEMQI
jgi:hypothetical protein